MIRNFLGSSFKNGLKFRMSVRREEPPEEGAVESENKFTRHFRIDRNGLKILKIWMF